MFNQFDSLSENEMSFIIGGGGISDLTVRVLTWIGDNFHRLQVEDPSLYM
ncbi:hypothetical protein CLV58_108164 [Spirosoma oryzae]|uniref:Uncharacterized protein n=1 Tax=Spirosoma oryzae TaxID=1469603 RepID=A0A2T0T0U2_9BACT|nr:hypothetical protein CLV58_108164 [Spirosoma oryzae]